MDDPALYKKFRRRKRRFQGADWTPPSMSAEIQDGVWCRKCKIRHGYRTLGFAFEHRNNGGDNRILWYCPKYKDVLKEVKLGV